MTGAHSPNGLARFSDVPPRGRSLSFISRSRSLPFVTSRSSPASSADSRYNSLRSFRKGRRTLTGWLRGSWTRRWSRTWLKKLNIVLLLFLPAFLLLYVEVPSGPAEEGQDFLISRVMVKPRSVRKGVSIVASCMNRHATLRTVLGAWLGVDGVDEVVLVDWTSQPPLKSIVEEVRNGDSRVKLIRVEGEASWVLSRAYNLAVKASSRDKIIRTDCDYSIGKDFLHSHNLENQGQKTHFFGGDYRQARNENELHLNGAVFIRRADFLRIGGYDERIQTYGWDDEDLYVRLRKAGVMKRNLSYEHVTHVPHSDLDRAQTNVNFVQVEIDLNQLLLQKLPPWTASTREVSNWTVIRPAHGQDIILRAKDIPRSLRELTAAPDVEAAWDLSLGRRLRNDYEIPWDIMSTMTIVHKKTLLARLNKRKAAAGDSTKPQRVFFAHCMHGLGNRLRALGSSMAFAQSTGRELVVIWEADAHNAAKFDELFTSDLIVLNSFHPKWPFKDADKWDKAWLDFRAHNYMEMEGNGAVKGEKIADIPDKHIYYKGAYVIEAEQTGLTNWELDNKMLRSLHPVEEVKLAVQKQEARGLKEMIGFHIRDRTLSRDIKNVDFKSEYGDQASKEMEYWRQKSSHRNFIDEMHRLVKEDPLVKFYVATDTREVLSTLQREFPGKIYFTSRDCDGRDGHCVRYALIDILCLAKTKLLYGSNWSSFTEAAERIGGKKAKLAGRDFAIDKNRPSG